MKSLFIILVFSIFTFCSNFTKNQPGALYYSTIKNLVGYQLDQPTEKHILGLELDEISGIEFINPSEIAAIHDEEGKIFIYNWKEKKVSDRIKFGKSGDYEDLQWVHGNFYVIKSNGHIYKVKASDPPAVKEYNNALNISNDAEGLTYLEEANALLIALKGQGEVEKNKADGKGFYLFKLDNKKISKDPLFTIRKKDLREALPDSLYTYFNEGEIDFSPSGIAIHPITKQLHIISSHGKWMVILNNDYSIQYVIPLDRKIFRQPEGITFSNQGDLFISNEAGNGSANILKFEYSPKK